MFSVPSACWNLPCCGKVGKWNQKKIFQSQRSWNITKQPNLPSIQASNECYWMEIPGVPLCLRSSSSSVSLARDWREAALLHCRECQPRGCESSSPARKKICWNEIYRDSLRSTLEKLRWEERLRAGTTRGAQCVSIPVGESRAHGTRASQGHPGQGKRQCLWKSKESCFSTERILLRGWWATGWVCPEGLWSLHLWRHSELTAVPALCWVRAAWRCPEAPSNLGCSVTVPQKMHHCSSKPQVTLFDLCVRLHFRLCVTNTL